MEFQPSKNMVDNRIFFFILLLIFSCKNSSKRDHSYFVKQENDIIFFGDSNKFINKMLFDKTLNTITSFYIDSTFFILNIGRDSSIVYSSNSGKKIKKIIFKDADEAWYSDKPKNTIKWKNFYLFKSKKELVILDNNFTLIYDSKKIFFDNYEKDLGIYPKEVIIESMTDEFIIIKLICWDGDVLPSFEINYIDTFFCKLD